MGGQWVSKIILCILGLAKSLFCFSNILISFLSWHSIFYFPVPVCLILSVCELTALDLALQLLYNCSSVSSSLALVLALWEVVGLCPTRGLVQLPSQQRERSIVNHFPYLVSRRYLLLLLIQSSMHVCATEEAKVQDSPQRSRHCYVRPPLSVLTGRQLKKHIEQMFKHFVLSKTELATRCTAQMAKCVQ